MTDAIDLLFGGMEKLGPGSNTETVNALRLLPRQHFRLIVDAGCGTGRQTIALARSLGTLIHAVDSHEPFLQDLQGRAADSGMGHLVQTHCMDMRAIPQVFHDIDLLWSEGAAYNIGFANALSTWAPALIPGGFAVISELSWLKDRAPDVAREFFRTGYPDMQSVPHNVGVAARAGYRVLATRTVPDQDWVDGYYDVLAPRASALVQHSDPAIRDMAAETLREIEAFQQSGGSYGYVFYVLERI